MKTPLIAINGRFLTQEITGVQRYAIEMTRALFTLGERYKFVIFAPQGNLRHRLPHLVQDKFPLWGHAWEQIRLPWLMKKFKANLLWCPCNSAPILRSEVPFIVTIHDAACFHEPKWFSKAFRVFYLRLIPRIGRISNKIITCSNYSKDELIKYDIADKNKIEVIYEGFNHIDPERNANNEIRDLSSRIQGKPYIFILGSRDPRKNVNRLLSAWNQIPQKVKNGRVLVLTGGQSAVFAREKTPEIKEDVIFMGYVSDEQLSALYKHAEAFVFPSLYEGFGLPPLEAMICGVPVLVSCAASLPEVCGDAALYLDPYDIDDIREKLVKMITDNLLKEELAAKGRQRAEWFTWERAAYHLLNVFDKIIANN